jgi:hypothetical protein
MEMEQERQRSTPWRKMVGKSSHALALIGLVKVGGASTFKSCSAIC